MKVKWFPRLWISLSAAILPCVVLLLGTAIAFLGNTDEFEVGYSLVSTFYPVPFLALFLLLFIPSLIPAEGWWQRYSAAVFVLGVLLWLQGNFLMWDYGVLDARGMHWEAFTWQHSMDFLIWIAAVAVAIGFSATLSKAIPFTVWMLIVMQGVTFYWTLREFGGEEFWIKKFEVHGQPPEEIFHYSRTRNILHIVMDSFQTDIFHELVQEEDIEEDLDGFTLFWNNAGAAPYTSFSIPAIFSGKVYEGSVTEQEYYQRSMTEGFQNTLYDKGYVVNLVPEMSMRESRYSNYYDIPKIYNGSQTEIARQHAAFLLDISLFRHVPHLLRQWVYNENNWRISLWMLDPSNVASLQQKIFFRDYTTRISPTREEPVYSFVHIWPPHPPYVTDEDGDYAGTVLPNTRENFKNEARAALYLFLDFIEKLKEAGAYDQSLIILQGDHGGSSVPRVDGEDLDFIPTRLAALLTVKLPGKHGPLQVSEAPTSIVDVANTILKSEGLKSDFPGRPVFEISPDEDRERWYAFFRGEERKDRTLSLYSIRGSIYRADSYREESRHEIQVRQQLYNLGDEIQFGLEGNGQPYLGAGWAAQMDRYCWTKQDRATLEIDLPPTTSDLVLAASYIPNVSPPVLPEQRIGVLVNGERVATWNATERKKLQSRAQVPANLTEKGHLTIEFELPDAASPSKLGLGGDLRELGIALYTISLTPLPEDPATPGE
ncbi:MAG: sulfatase-like hydrolase/transferase [Acidobacteriota bacterium]|nr:MAG: sulfatase-like hydrolase/transferase [Acidobacteriota bacterium]